MLLATLLLAAVFTTRASAGTPHVLHGEGVGSTWTVTIADPPRLDSGTVERGIQSQIDAAAREVSRWDSRSTLSELNAAADEQWHSIGSGLAMTLAFALQLASDTNGAYDPTVAPLVDVWGFGPQGRRFAPPSDADVRAARARVGWTRIELDASNGRVRKPAATQIDLSSMQHGFAADRVAAYLRSIGVTRFLVDVGSELRAQGHAPEGHAWRVAIERPPPELTPVSGDMSPATASESGESSAPLRVVALRDAGIATSGNYRYFFDYNGRRYSHRIDPRTGEPITHPLAAVTVINPECMRADALATALTVLGPDEGYEYARRRGIAALFVIRTAQGLEERMTPMFERYLD